MTVERHLRGNDKNVPQGGSVQGQDWVVTTEAERLALAGMNDGDFCVVNDNKMIYDRIAGAWIRRPRTLFVMTSSLSDVGKNVTTQNTLIGSGVYSKTLWANLFEAGTILRIRASGTRTMNLMTDRTCTFRLKKGSTVLWSAAATLPAIADRYPWLLDVAIIGRSATTVSASGMMFLRVADGTTYYNNMIQPGQLPSQPITISASAEDIDFTEQFSVADGDDWIDPHDFIMTLE